MLPTRLLLFVALTAALLASCSAGATPDSAPDATPMTSSTTSTDADVEEAQAAPSTTTTQAPTTSTTAPPAVTTTIPMSQPPQAAPTVALDSFNWSFATTIRADEADLLSVESRGVFVEGAFDCEITAGFGGFDFTTRLVVLDDTAYFDDGTGAGPVEVAVDDPNVVDNLGLCAGSDGFWSDITGGETLPDGGDSEERNGIPTRRLNLAGILDQAGALGLFTPGVEGVSFDTLDFWVADPGGWIAAIEMNASLASEAVEGLTGSTVAGDGGIRVTLDVTEPNDGSLLVAAP